MRKINYKADIGELEIEVSNELFNIIAKRENISPDLVSDDMVVRFLNLATNVAFDRADAEYVASNEAHT